LELPVSFSAQNIEQNQQHAIMNMFQSASTLVSGRHKFQLIYKTMAPTYCNKHRQY